MLPTPYVKCDYEKVYEPSEDSFLLLDILEKERQYLADRFSKSLNVVCEIGVGSGIVTTFMMQNTIPSAGHLNLYYAIDVNHIWSLYRQISRAALELEKLTFLYSIHHMYLLRMYLLFQKKPMIKINGWTWRCWGVKMEWT